MNAAVIANIIAGIGIALMLAGGLVSIKSDMSALQTAVNIKFEYVTRDIAELKEYILPHRLPAKP